MDELFVLIALMMTFNPKFPLKLTASSVNDRNSLEWLAVGWAQGSTVQRKVDFGDFVDIYDTSELNYDDLDVEVGKTYTYRVRFNNPNFSMYSNAISLQR